VHALYNVLDEVMTATNIAGSLDMLVRHCSASLCMSQRQLTSSSRCNLQALGRQEVTDSLTDALLLLMRYSLHAAFPLFWFLSKQNPLPAITRSHIDVLRCAAEFLMHIRK
jgi:hypothetical protein